MGKTLDNVYKHQSLVYKYFLYVVSVALIVFFFPKGGLRVRTSTANDGISAFFDPDAFSDTEGDVVHELYARAPCCAAGTRVWEGACD